MEVSFAQMTELVAKAEKIVISTHVSPDGDALGSMLGMYHYLRKQHKDVKMMLDDDVSERYSFLPGIDEIMRPEMCQKADLLIELDAADETRCGVVASMVDAPILNIDHHISNSNFADYSYVDARSAATAQILAGWLAGNGIDCNIALCFYTGIATDSGFFKYSNTTPETMRQAAVLMEAGVEPQLVSERIEEQSVQGMVLLAQALSTLKFFAAGRIAAITVDASTEDIDTEGLIDYPRKIVGVEIAVMFKIRGPKLVRVSFRSCGADVRKVAAAFGGGGHQRAAGCSIEADIDSVCRQVIAVASEELG